MPEGKNRGVTIVFTAVLFLAFAVADYYAPRPVDHVPGNYWWFLFGSAVGACIAQVTLIAAWAVFAPGNIVARLPWALLFGLMTWYALVFGRRAITGGWDHASPEEDFLLGAILLLGVVVLQIPLWIAKWAFRFRMTSPGEVPSASTQRQWQFQLRDLLIGTFVFALALSPIKYMLPKQNLGNLHPGEGNLPALVLAALVVNLVATIPCFWGGFMGRPVLRIAVLWGGCIFIITGVEFGLLCAALGSPGPQTLEVFAAFCAMNLCQGAVVFAIMRVYHALGYRLQRVPRFAAAQPEAPA